MHRLWICYDEEEVICMTEEMKKQRQAEATKALDEVQAAMYAVLKPLGFRKHGRVFHRFVEEDISQVVELQRGQAYREETHLFWVNVGVRVPECQLRSFAPEENAKKYYHEWECSLRYTLGEKSKRQTGAYDLRKPLEPIIGDVLGRLQTSVLPAFEALSSREAILARRADYPQFYSDWMPLLMEAMICGRRGEMDRVTALFSEHYRTCGDPRYPQAAQAHRAYLRELAEKLGITITPEDDEAPET
ncbi:MAG: DUF4304 domain-containing protein [Clostridia bacterium]|nr:DUF4304 domain-containing protein [Clostridia bacterium]